MSVSEYRLREIIREELARALEPLYHPPFVVNPKLTPGSLVWVDTAHDEKLTG